MTSKSWAWTCGLRASSSAEMLSRDVVVTRPTFQPPSLAALIVSATPGRGASPAVAIRSRASFDFVSWTAWASTSSPRDRAYPAIRSWPPLVDSMAR